MEQNHNNILIEIKETGVMSDKATEELKSALNLSRQSLNSEVILWHQCVT